MFFFVEILKRKKKKKKSISQNQNDVIYTKQVHAIFYVDIAIILRRALILWVLINPNTIRQRSDNDET